MCRESVRYVYIMSSLTRVLYTGSTTDLRRRVYQHKHGLLPGFTQEYSRSPDWYTSRARTTSVPRSNESDKSRAGGERRSSG